MYRGDGFHTFRSEEKSVW